MGVSYERLACERCPDCKVRIFSGMPASEAVVRPPRLRLEDAKREEL